MARASSPSFLRELPVESTRTLAESLGRHVHHGFAGHGQPPRQVPTKAAGVLHRLGRRSGNLFAQRSSALKTARSRSSPKASSTAATATDALWGSTPMSTFMRAHLRFGRTSAVSARRTFRLWVLFSRLF